MNIHQLTDFCRYNDTFQSYYNIPHYIVNPNYHKTLGKHGQSRKSFIFGQSLRALQRFLNGSPEHFRFHIDYYTFEPLTPEQYQNFDNRSMYIYTSLDDKGLKITIEYMPSFVNPTGLITFYARSHNEYSQAGILKEVQKEIKKYLFGSGYYRRLQEIFEIPVAEFKQWYIQYRKETEETKRRAEAANIELRQRRKREVEVLETAKYCRAYAWEMGITPDEIEEMFINYAL